MCKKFVLVVPLQIICGFITTQGLSLNFFGNTAFATIRSPHRYSVSKSSSPQYSLLLKCTGYFIMSNVEKKLSTSQIVQRLKYKNFENSREYKIEKLH